MSKLDDFGTIVRIPNLVRETLIQQVRLYKSIPSMSLKKTSIYRGQYKPRGISNVDNPWPEGTVLC